MIEYIIAGLFCGFIVLFSISSIIAVLEEDKWHQSRHRERQK